MENPVWRISMFEEEEETRKGPWTLEEDMRLMAYINMLGAGRWSSVAKAAGLKRSGKSCRLRWVNYLRPDLKRGSITREEERLIVDLHGKWGNRWSRIAQSLPGRTDNKIKNYWRTHIKKKSTELTRTSSWPPSLKSPPEIISVKETTKPSSSINAVSFVKEQVENCYEDSNEINCDHSASASDGSHAWLSLQGPNEEFKNAPLCVEAVSGMVSEAAYAGDIVEDGAASSYCSMPASPVNDNQGFFWDYNSLLLWNLDDDVHNMDYP